MLASLLEYDLVTDIFVRLYELRGISIEVIRHKAEWGNSRVPWVYFKFCNTGKKSATPISFKEFREAFLHYIFTATIFYLSIKSENNPDLAKMAIAHPESILNPFTCKVGMVGNKLGYIQRKPKSKKRKLKQSNTIPPVFAWVGSKGFINC